MASRRQSIRTRIILLLAVPFAALIGLWAVAASSSLGEATLLIKAKTVQDKLIQPVHVLVIGLQDERRLSMAYLGSPSAQAHTELEKQRTKTTALGDAYRRDVADPDLRGVARLELVARMDELANRLGELATFRQAIDGSVMSRSMVLTEFDSLIDAGFAVYNEVVSGNAEIDRQARTLTELGKAHEMIARETALMTGVLSKGKLTQDERDQFALLSGSQQFLYQDSVPQLPLDEQRRFQQMHDGPVFAHFRQLEQSLIDVPAAQPGRGDHLPVTSQAWDNATQAAVQQLYDFENNEIDNVSHRAENIAIGVLLRLALTGGLGLVAIVVSVVVAVRSGRRIVREARTLASAVEIFTRDQLPALADRVRRGELIEADGRSVTAGQVFTVTEVDKLSTAFEASRLAVVRASSSEAAARRGVSELFINLARRNQALLHRQLGLLDSMERRVEDPEDLEDLFQLDHLATCMRRHAEGLVILAGRNAGRSWRSPVPIVDVARAAVAEVEDYTRVEVMPMPRAALAGAAVADTIHLVAELIENAVMFSPPDSLVRISAAAVPNGLALEVEDRGLGMSPELLAELNERLAQAPEFDIFDSARLGTFVVSRLAARHGVKVSLRASPYGGTTAIVLLPADIIVTAEVTPPTESAQDAEPADSAAEESVVVASAARVQPAVIRTSAPPDPNDTYAGLPRRRKAEVAPTPPVSAPVPGAAGPMEEHMGLPKRRRQANLAPQLREAPADNGSFEAADTADEAPPQRSPEEARSLMSAMQRGWQQGRITSERPALSPEEDSR